MRRIVAAVAITAASTLLALALGEVAVRALFKDETVIYPRQQTDYRYGDYRLRGIRPNAHFWHASIDGSWEFVTNSKGLRDHREFSYEKQAGTLRVLTLGDSHTQGYEVRQEATYSAVLERYLEAHGVRSEVLNAGVSGFSTAEALAYLENEGYRYAPDVVVLGFYGNDFQDNVKAGLFAVDDHKLVVRRKEHVPGVAVQNLLNGIPGVPWLSENSYFYSLLFNNVWMYFKLALNKQAARQATGDGADDFEYAVPAKREPSPSEISLAAALIQRMAEFCRAKGIRMILVDIPRPAAPYRIAESLPASVLQKLTDGAKPEIVSSVALLGEWQGVAEMHVPHGHRHISEFVHALIGWELGRRIGPQGVHGAPLAHRGDVKKLAVERPSRAELLR